LAEAAKTTLAKKKREKNRKDNVGLLQSKPSLFTYRGQAKSYRPLMQILNVG